MVGSFLVYALCAFSGILVERRLAVNNLFQRVMLVLAAAAAQLMVAIQLLSSWKGLTGTQLALINLVLSAAVIAILRLRPSPQRLSWSTLLDQPFSECREQRKDLWSLCLLAMGAGLFAAACIGGWIMLPMNDSYHFEMPLFWIQNHTILPFAVHNPRIVSLSFLSEVLQVPGYLYGHWRGTPALATIFWGLLSLWVIFSLSRRIGAGWFASVCAAAIASGYTSFVLNCFHTGAEMFLAGAFFGVSLLFLIDANAKRMAVPFTVRDFGCSVFCFLMACGAKNSTTLLAPVYLAFLAFAAKGAIAAGVTAGDASRDPTRQIPAGTRPKEPEGPAGRARKIILCIGMCGLAGLLCSGVAWNYTSNKIWFGRKGLPKAISTTVSQDFHPRAIWTRICRGGVLLAYDTLWVPRGARERYVSLCQNTVRLLGGQNEISDDDEYYSFKESKITPLKGLGLLGIVYFVPALIWACVCLARRHDPAGKPGSTSTFNTALLVLMTIASFTLCHLVLRWQGIGLLRLMFPFVIAGAPLTAFLMQRRWLRVSALPVLLITAAMFSTYFMAHIARHLGWSDRPSLRMIARMQNSHELTVQYQWKGQSTNQLIMKEDFTYREIYQTLLQGIRQPATLGFIGDIHVECTYLFGSRFQNRVVPLVDARADDRILPPPAGLDYVIAVALFPEARDWAKAHGFEEVFGATNAQGDMLLAFQKHTLTAREQPTSNFPPIASETGVLMGVPKTAFCWQKNPPG